MFMNGYTEQRVIQEQKMDQMRQAEHWRLLREAGLLRTTQIKRSTCWLLCRVGKALVALGQQLEQYDQPTLATQER